MKGKTTWRDDRMLRSHLCFSTANGSYATDVHRCEYSEAKMDNGDRSRCCVNRMRRPD